eukprot:13085-Chlamydomonas_euryale.AAC.2
MRDSQLPQQLYIFLRLLARQQQLRQHRRHDRPAPQWRSGGTWSARQRQWQLRRRRWRMRPPGHWHALWPALCRRTCCEAAIAPCAGGCRHARLVEGNLLGVEVPLAALRHGSSAGLAFGCSAAAAGHIGSRCGHCHIQCGDLEPRRGTGPCLSACRGSHSFAAIVSRSRACLLWLHAAGIGQRPAHLRLQLLLSLHADVQTSRPGQEHKFWFVRLLCPASAAASLRTKRFRAPVSRSATTPRARSTPQRSNQPPSRRRLRPAGLAQQLLCLAQGCRGPASMSVLALQRGAGLGSPKFGAWRRMSARAREINGLRRCQTRKRRRDAAPCAHGGTPATTDVISGG